MDRNWRIPRSMSQGESSKGKGRAEEYGGNGQGDAQSGAGQAQVGARASSEDNDQSMVRLGSASILGSEPEPSDAVARRIYNDEITYLPGILSNLNPAPFSSLIMSPPDAAGQMSEKTTPLVDERGSDGRHPRCETIAHSRSGSNETVLTTDSMSDHGHFYERRNVSPRDSMAKYQSGRVSRASSDASVVTVIPAKTTPRLLTNSQPSPHTPEHAEQDDEQLQELLRSSELSAIRHNRMIHAIQQIVNTHDNRITTVEDQVVYLRTAVTDIQLQLQDQQEQQQTMVTRPTHSSQLQNRPTPPVAQQSRYAYSPQVHPGSHPQQGYQSRVMPTPPVFQQFQHQQGYQTRVMPTPPVFQQSQHQQGYQARAMPTPTVFQQSQHQQGYQARAMPTPPILQQSQLGGPHSGSLGGPPPQFAPKTPNSVPTTRRQATAAVSDDVFRPARFDQKDYSELVQSVCMKAEAAVRQYLVMPVLTSFGDPQVTHLVKLGSAHLDHRNMALKMIEDYSMRTSLVVGMLNRWIAEHIYNKPLLSMHVNQFLAGQFDVLWKQEVKGGEGPMAANRYGPREIIANERAGVANQITREPGFWKWQQELSVILTNDLVREFAPLVRHDLVGQAHNEMYRVVNEAVKIVMRMRTDDKVFMTTFHKYGSRYDSKYMVHRNPELHGQACDEDPCPWVVRVTMVPAVEEKCFKGAKFHRRLLQKGEVMLCERKSHLR
ncbi:hypothetical protein LTR08_002679 [Meristemomyces frigidus]|nr:hypothetical protein LTR08_002679 [Meristemomyces frigidus]